MKAERRSLTISKTSKLSARSTSTPLQPSPAANDDHGSADDDDNHTLRLFKHTPLPTSIDDDTTTNTNPPATHTSTATNNSRRDQSGGLNDRTDAPSQPTVKLTAADYDTLKSIYTTIATTATQLTKTVRAHLTALPSLPSTTAGNSLYELKNRLLLQYIVRMVHIIRLRVSGASIANEPSVDEMNEIRVILERIRPIEKRIKYSIDKLLAAPTATSSSSGAATSTDPLQYRPNPLDLLPATASTASTAHTATARKQPYKAAAAVGVSPPSSPAASSVYQAPHHVPTLPIDSRSSRQPRVSAARLRSLSAEVGDRPEERLVEGGGYGEMGEASEEEEERREYEERMMVRLVETKVDKKRKRDREQRKGLDGIDEYDELRQFVERRERGDRGGETSEVRDGGERRASGKGAAAAAAAGGGRSSVDELFNGVERGEGPRKRAKQGSKKGKAGKGGKGRGGKRR